MLHTDHRRVPCMRAGGHEYRPVPLSHTGDTMDVGNRDRRDFGRDRAQDQVLAQEYATAALQY